MVYCPICGKTNVTSGNETPAGRGSTQWYTCNNPKCGTEFGVVSDD